MEKLLREGEIFPEREMRGYRVHVRVSSVGIKPHSGDVLPMENWQDLPWGKQK